MNQDTNFEWMEKWIFTPLIAISLVLIPICIVSAVVTSFKSDKLYTQEDINKVIEVVNRDSTDCKYSVDKNAVYTSCSDGYVTSGDIPYFISKNPQVKTTPETSILKEERECKEQKGNLKITEQYEDELKTGHFYVGLPPVVGYKIECISPSKVISSVIIK